MYQQQVSPWEILQETTMVKWVNTKLIEDTISPQTPTSTYSNIPETINNLTDDLQDSLVLTKLVNRIIYEITLNPDHPMNAQKSKLYYLTPIYKKPTFKLQKLENLLDLLKFLNLILGINVVSISPENIFDGDLKLSLGLVWSLFIFNASSCFPGNPSYMTIKTILLKWLNGILKDKTIKNFSKDWAVEPEVTIYEIVSHYDPLAPAGMDLPALMNYLEDSIALPKFIDPEDFQYTDEKCIIVYLIELYKIFEIEKSYNEVEVDLLLRFDDVIKSTLAIFKLKSTYESKALKFSKQLNTLINQLTLDYDNLQVDFTTDLQNCLKLLENSIIDPKKLAAFQNNFDILNIKLTSLVNILQRFQNFRCDIKPELMYLSYPEIIQILGNIKVALQSFGPNIDYVPASKTLNIDPISTKLDQLISLDSKFLDQARQVIAAVNSDLLFTKLNILKSAKPKNELVRAECQITVEYFLGFSHKLDLFEASLKSRITSKYIEPTELPEVDVTPELFNQFKAVLSRHNNCRHDELFRVMLEEVVTPEFSSRKLELFTRLIPIKSSPISPNDSNFDLLSSTSFEDDDVFDELQQRLDSHLLLTNDKIYDIKEFIRRFENGFKL
ncbi:Filamin-A [Candida viswanathii]|uniref:Filamin-A n=1 Tax=Candida viswanathii TaxID=5486 RepID=A0A367YSA7_9ASCO|nr:Filamin-A [Candida viswanathii]